MRRPGQKFTRKSLHCNESVPATTDDDNDDDTNGSRRSSIDSVVILPNGHHRSAAGDAQLLMLQRLYDELRQITARMAKDEDDDHEQNDWVM